MTSTWPCSAARSRRAASPSRHSGPAVARTWPQKEEAEIAIIGEYLPAALTEDEIAALVREGIAATGASSARDMGKVMGWLAPRTRGRADGKHLSELVVQALASADLAAHDVGTH